MTYMYMVQEVILINQIFGLQLKFVMSIMIGMKQNGILI